MTLQVTLDGVDVTDVVQDATSQHWLNKKYVATVKIPVAQAFIPSDGARLKLVDTDLPGNTIEHHGTVKFLSAADGDEAGDGEGLCEYTSESAREIWEWRRARDGPNTSTPGNYIKPNMFEELQQGPVIMEDVLTQSMSGPGVTGEGDMAITLGGFSSAGISLSGMPMATPMSIEELANLLASTGEVDIVETMIDSGGAMSQVDGYDGNFGTDLSGTVSYVYEPNGTARGAKLTYDAGKLANKIRYLLGPRVTDFRWRRSIEASNLDIPDTSTYTQADLVAAIMASRAAWLIRDDVRIYDQFNVEADAVPLYWRLWQDESMWRLQPRKLYSVLPLEGFLPAFDIGDLIHVGAHTGFMGGFAGTQRVFGRQIRWDVDGVATLGTVQTSADSDTLA